MRYRLYCVKTVKCLFSVRIKYITRIAFSTAHTSAKAANVAKLLPLDKHRVINTYIYLTVTLTLILT